jgi:hypothetical protein
METTESTPTPTPTPTSTSTSTGITRTGGRKFLLALFCIASATALVWANHISDGVYSAIVIAVACAFITGNVVQKAVSKPVT